MSTVTRKELLGGAKRWLLERRDTILVHQAGTEQMKSMSAQNDYLRHHIADSVPPVDEDVDRELLELRHNELVLIDDALDRVRDGTYGFCSECGAEIPVARLEALRYATMCIGCAEREERCAPGKRARDRRTLRIGVA